MVAMEMTTAVKVTPSQRAAKQRTQLTNAGTLIVRSDTLHIEKQHCISDVTVESYRRDETISTGT